MISKKDVQHIARLARIELTPAEEEKFEKELSSILEFVDKLNGVDTFAVRPMTGGTMLENVTREDGVRNNESRIMNQELVEAAPTKRNGYIEVKAVFEREA